LYKFVFAPETTGQPSDKKELYKFTSMPLSNPFYCSFGTTPVSIIILVVNHTKIPYFDREKYLDLDSGHL
jgi:hypothetical protein